MRIGINIEKQLTSGCRTFLLSADFEVDDRHISLLGPSGSGKTLTLSCIAGLVNPDSGRIVLNGRVLFDSEKGINVPARHRKAGYVFQDYALFPHLTVAENVGFGLSRGLSGGLAAKDRDRVMEFLDAFGIAALAKSFPKDVSGGQKQRVALARALIVKPEVILLDEPFSALDAPLRKNVRSEVKETLDRFGVGGILISHDPEDIRAFGGTVLYCDSGRVGTEKC